MPVAVNCCVEPTFRLEGYAGVTLMDDNVAVVPDPTIKVTGVLVIRSRDAIIVALPDIRPYANPPEVIVATLALVLSHVTSLVRSAVEPSE
jgi:hypothetical protein